MKKLLIGTAAMALLAPGVRPARRQAKEYVFALVPKNMNNPFFDQARDGCKKAEAESAASSSASISAPVSMAAATSRCRSCTT